LNRLRRALLSKGIILEKIADLIREPAAWRSRIRGYAMAYRARLLQISGDHQAAEATFREARRLWSEGADPAALLDPGTLVELEAD
jgi:hypothetical protein